MIARAHVFVSGRVQGVFFRDAARKKAEGLELAGWVKNLKDGRVEAVFEGKKEKVKEILEWTQKGPFLARVDNLDIIWEDYKGGEKGFTIKRDL